VVEIPHAAASVAPNPSSAGAPVEEDSFVELSLDERAEVRAQGFPCVAKDGATALSLETQRDGLRGWDGLELWVFDARAGGGPRRRLHLIETDDFENAPENAEQAWSYHRQRRAPRLAAAKEVLSHASWVPLSSAAAVLDVKLERTTLIVRRDADVVVRRDYPHWSIPASGAPGSENYCAHEAFVEAAHVDDTRRIVLVHVAYRSQGPDWCDADGQVEQLTIPGTPGLTNTK